MPPAPDTAPGSDSEVDYTSDDDVGVTKSRSIPEFKSDEVLNEADWQRRTVAELCAMMGTDFLDVNPYYQRDVVWAPDRMSKLIQSLLANFYVPPVIFNVQRFISKGEDRWRRICIDGKQRLTSICDFVSGKIPVLDSKNQKWYFCEGDMVSKQNKRILPEHIRARFLDTDILCVEYNELGREQEEDLFSRVQLGVPLTPAEKLKASTGEWQKFAADIERTYSNLMCTVDNKRGRCFQLILQIFKQMINADDPATSSKFNASPSALKTFCKSTSLLTPEFKARARRVFDTYAEILEQFPRTFQNNDYKIAAKFSPIEFVAMAVLIYNYPGRQNLNLLSGDILALRSHVRQVRQDLRSNSVTWSVLMQWINNIERYRGGPNTVRVSAPVADMSRLGPGQAARPQTLRPNDPISTRKPLPSRQPDLSNLSAGQASPSTHARPKNLPPRLQHLPAVPTGPSFTPNRRQDHYREETDPNRSRKRGRGEDVSGGRRIKQEKSKAHERVGPFTLL